MFRRYYNRIIRKLLLQEKEVQKTPVPDPLRVDISPLSFVSPNSFFDFRLQKEDRLYVTIGEKCIINAGFTFETSAGRVKIGNNVHIGFAHFICRTGITVEDDVTMAWGITLYDHNSHSVDWEYRKNDNRQCYEDYINFKGNNIVNKNWEHVNTKAIKICSKVWIGFDVTVLKGVTIGEGAVIGAKSVVTKDVPAWTVVAGNPARVVRELKKDQL